MVDEGMVAAAGTTLIICSRGRAGMLIDTIEDILHGNAVPDEIFIVEQHPTADADIQRPHTPSQYGRQEDRRFVWQIGRHSPAQACGVSLRAEDYGLGAGPTIYERGAPDAGR
jgi:hypothetical protein